MARIQRFCSLLFVVLASSAFLAAPAQAELRVCNQTSYILYTAVGYVSGTTAQTHGWTRIVPGDCDAVITDPLTASTYYLHARSSEGHSGPSRAWGGTIQFCAKDANFSLQSPVAVPGCHADDSFPLPFASVSTHGKKSWTTTLTESPLLTSLDVAREVGIVRLLNDIGYKVTGKTGPDGNKSRDDALIQFRLKKKLPVTATNEDLFAALETEAIKASAPSGYSVCNDGDSEIWAAVGMQSAGNWMSRGWWKVPPGACAKALTDPLSTDKIYLLAENQTNGRLVTGPAKFCITNIEFEVVGRDKCASKGLSEVGFAETDTKGRTGYAAHVGKDGLLVPKPLLAQPLTPK